MGRSYKFFIAAMGRSYKLIIAAVGRSYGYFSSRNNLRFM